jgi:hypothetical protein
VPGAASALAVATLAMILEDRIVMDLVPDCSASASAAIGTAHHSFSCEWQPLTGRAAVARKVIGEKSNAESNKYVGIKRSMGVRRGLSAMEERQTAMPHTTYSQLIEMKRWADRGLYAAVRQDFDRLSPEESAIMLCIFDHIHTVDRIFQHHRDHRGQAADILYYLDVLPPTTDLPVFLRQQVSCPAPSGPIN